MPIVSDRIYSQLYLSEAQEIINQIDVNAIEKMVDRLVELRENKGRLFFLGVGGSAANCSHAVNDFRKIAGIEAYTPTDNVAELTARTNDDGWATTFVEWLKISQLSPKDVVFILSVGGGDLVKNISPNLVAALEYAVNAKAKILGVVGRDGGVTAKLADLCLLVPTVNEERITPHTESFQALVLHLMVSHPKLQKIENE